MYCFKNEPHKNLSSHCPQKGSCIYSILFRSIYKINSYLSIYLSISTLTIYFKCVYFMNLYAYQYLFSLIHIEIFFSNKLFDKPWYKEYPLKYLLYLCIFCMKYLSTKIVGTTGKEESPNLSIDKLISQTDKWAPLCLAQSSGRLVEIQIIFKKQYRRACINNDLAILKCYTIK